MAFKFSNTGGFGSAGQDSTTKESKATPPFGQVPSSGGFSFARPDPNANLSSSASPFAQVSGSGSFGFGQTPGAASGSFAASRSSGLFGASQPQVSDGGGLFGTVAPTSGGSGSSLFGNARPQTTASGGLFGNNNAQTAPRVGLFGQPLQSNQQSGGLFGTPAQPTGGIFGNTQPQPSGGLFGQPHQHDSQQHGGLFGPSTTQQGGFSLFRNPVNVGGANNNHNFACSHVQPWNQVQPNATPFATAPQANPGAFGQSTQPKLVSCLCNSSVPAPPTIAFVPRSEKDYYNSQTSSYQTITCMEPYERFSLEELRLFDYNAGRWYGVQAPAASVSPFITNIASTSKDPSPSNAKDEQIKHLKATIKSLEQRVADSQKHTQQGSQGKEIQCECGQQRKVPGERWMQKCGCGAHLQNEEYANMDPLMSNTGTFATGIFASSTVRPSDFQGARQPLPQAFLPAFPSVFPPQPTAAPIFPNVRDTAKQDAGTVPTKQEITKQLDSQTQRIKDIETQLSKITSLLGQQTLNASSNAQQISQEEERLNTKTDTPTPVKAQKATIFTPGSSTDTTPGVEQHTDGNDFVDLASEAGISSPSTEKATQQDSHTQTSVVEPTANPKPALTLAQQAFTSWTIAPEINDKLSRQAKEIWWHLRNHYSPINNGRAGARHVRWIANDLKMTVTAAVKGTEELHGVGLIIATVDEDTFTVSGGKAVE